MNKLADQASGPNVDDVELLSWIRRAADEHAIMAITDAQGVIVFVNDRFCQISGYTRDELLGRTHRVVRSDFHPPEFFADLWRTIGSGKVWHGTVCNRAKSGKNYWVESTIVPHLGTDGRPKYYLALRTDITRLKETEEANARLVKEAVARAEELRTAQDELRILFDHAPIGISWREFTRQGHPGANHVNRKFCELIGLTAEEARDIENVRRATHPEDWEKQMRLTEEVYAGKRDTFTLDKRYIHRDGRVVWGILTVAIIRDAKGVPTHHFAMLEDITARRAAEDELRRSESRWRTYLSTASEILYALTPEYTFKFVSAAWTTKLGHPLDEVLGRSFFEFVHPDDVPACRRFIAGIMEGTPDSGAVEYRMQHRNGEWTWHASTGSAYLDRDGRRAYFGVGRDISLRRRAQDELRTALARREELERIINRSPSVVVLWRAEEGWPVEFVSQSISQFGYTPEEFTDRRRNFVGITHPDDRDRVMAEVAAHAEAGHMEYNQEYRILCADGSARWVDDHTVVRRDAAGRVTHHEGLITDITARHEAEERERAVRERDLRVAGEIQQHLRPRVFPDITEVEIEALAASSMLIGGDYYDVLPVSGRSWGFVVADVSGKGAGAALMMAECRATLRLCAAGELSPAAVLRRVNRAIQPDMRPGMYIALFYGILDLNTNRLRFCRAGHEPALLLRRGADKPELLPGGGLALGLDEGSLFDEMLEEREVEMQPGDLLALYTDGITEACNPKGEEFSRDRLATALQKHEEKPLAEVARKVDRYVRNFCALAPRHDDRTLLLVRPR
jgi:PAS domain S-box-containing protein